MKKLLILTLMPLILYGPQELKKASPLSTPDQKCSPLKRNKRALGLDTWGLATIIRKRKTYTFPDESPFTFMILTPIPHDNGGNYSHSYLPCSW